MSQNNPMRPSQQNQLKSITPTDSPTSPDQPNNQTSPIHSLADSAAASDTTSDDGNDIPIRTIDKRKPFSRQSVATQPNNRRESFGLPNNNNNGNNSQENRVDAVVVASVPAFKDKLEDISPQSIVKIENKIYSYEFEHKVKVRLISAITDLIKNKLMNKYKPSMTEIEFNNLPDSEIYDMLLISAKPKTSTEFIKLLKNGVKFRQFDDDFIPSIGTFEQVYSHILDYVRNFKQIIDSNAAREHKPKVWGSVKVPAGCKKQENLVDIFLSKFPCDIGPALHTLLMSDKTVADENSIVHYIDSFCQRLCVLNDQCIVLQEFSAVLVEWRKELLATRNPRVILKSNVNHLNNVDAVCTDMRDMFDSDLMDNINSTAACSNNKPVCFKILKNQKCSRGHNCPFSHDRHKVRAARDAYVKHLMSIDYDDTDDSDYDDPD